MLRFLQEGEQWTIETQRMSFQGHCLGGFCGAFKCFIRIVFFRVLS